MLDRKKLEEVFIPHLRDRVKKGEIILFTGAGFSAGLPTSIGGHVPTTSELCQIFWRTAYRGEAYDGSTLPDLFETLQRQQKRELQRVLNEQFTANSQGIPDWYNLYVQIPWHKVYTLNIDTFWNAASVRFKSQRRITPVSALTSTPAAAEVNFAQVLPVVHLNGIAADGPDAVTFTARQYATRTANPDDWLLQFTAEQLAKSVIFIGTTLEEPSIWHYLDVRGQRGGRGISEHRPRSYLVSPSLPRAKRTALAMQNIEWIPMTAQQFSEIVLEAISDSIPSGLAYIEARESRERTSQRIPLVTELIATKKTDNNYLLGREPEWADVTEGRIADREEYAALVSAMRTELERKDEKSPIIMTGTAGAGKSSTMMKAAYLFTTEGNTTGWISRTDEVSPHDLAVAASEEDAPTILFIDGADQYGSSLQSLVYNISTTEPYPLVIVEMRSNKVDRLIERSSFGKNKPIEVVSQHLEDSDICNLLDVLTRENMLGRLTGMGRRAQEETFRRKSGRELIVAMYEATTGNRFTRKMIEEYDELRGTQKKLYGAACLATEAGFELSTEELFICTLGELNATMEELATLKRRNLLVDVPGKPGFYKARHRFIAERVSRALRRSGTAADIVLGLLRASAAKVDSQTRRGERALRILQTFMNHDRLHQFCNLEVARNVYSELEQLLKWSVDYWLHRGLLELKHNGSLEHAELYISTAESIDETHPNVRTQAAIVKMEKALHDPKSEGARELFETGRHELEQFIEEGRFRTNYPYHAIGAWGLRWAIEGVKDETERQEYLRKLNERLEKGALIHPRDPAVLDMAKKVKAAYLGSAAIKASSGY